MDKKQIRKLKKTLAHMGIGTQADLIVWMASCVAHRSGEDIKTVLAYLESSIKGLDILKKVDSEQIDTLSQRTENNNVLSEAVLDVIASGADHFLKDNSRVATGSYYTPPKWVGYMVKNVFAKWLHKTIRECNARIEYDTCLRFMAGDLLAHTEVYTLDEVVKAEVVRKLESVKVVDIACGAGSFLMETVRCMIFIENQINNTDNSSFEKVRNLVADNVYGIDIQTEPLAIYQLCLMLRYMDGENWRISPTVHCGSSLTDDAFQIGNGKFGEETYDIVVGNPPYLGEKGNTSLFREIRQTSFGEKYYEGKMDLSYFFTMKGLELLKPGGYLIYLTTNYFITADGARLYRNQLKNRAHFVEITNFNTYPLFKDAPGQHNMIFMLQKPESNSIEQQEESKTVIKYIKHKAYEDRMDIDTHVLLLVEEADKPWISVYSCLQSMLFRADGRMAILSEPEHREALRIYEEFCKHQLKDIFHIKQGIVSGGDQVSASMIEKKLDREVVQKFHIQKGDPIFVFNTLDSRLEGLEESKLKPFYKNSDILTYVVQEIPKRYIGYFESEIHGGLSSYPGWNEHLTVFKNVLEKRREVQTGTRPWYCLQWPRTEHVFEGKKIVVPQRHLVNKFAYTEIPFYGSADIYYMKSKEELSDSAWMYYLGILNGSVVYLWLYHYGKRKGELLELYAKPLLEVSVPIYNQLEWQDEIASRVASYLENPEQENEEELRNGIDMILSREMMLEADLADAISKFRFERG